MAGRFDPEEILRILDRHGVRFVVIGGLAATLHGSPHVTTDVDITPERGRKNLERLSAALRELNARVRVEGIPEGLPFGHSAESLGTIELLNLNTTHGALDICLEPAGTRGYPDLARDAVAVELLGVTVSVASLVDVIRSKEAAGRPKDELTLPTLRRLVEASRFVATAELPATGEVLLSLRIAGLGQTLPGTLHCRVRNLGLPDGWRRTRRAVDVSRRALAEVRYPADFEGPIRAPLTAGEYEVEWLQTSPARGGSVTGERVVAASRFTMTGDGEFVPGGSTR